VADGEVINLERLLVDRARWAEAALDIGGITGEAELLLAVEETLAGLVPVAGERLVALRFVMTGEGGLHRELVARREQFADEVQAAAQRVHGDIWLEKLEIRTKAPVARPPDEAMQSVDLGALLADVEGSADLRSKVEQLVADVKIRIPGTIGAAEQDFAGELDLLIAEARELLLNRASDRA
jgi:exonuclease SbcD